MNINMPTNSVQWLPQQLCITIVLLLEIYYIILLT